MFLNFIMLVNLLCFSLFILELHCIEDIQYLIESDIRVTIDEYCDRYPEALRCVEVGLGFNKRSTKAGLNLRDKKRDLLNRITWEHGKVYYAFDRSRARRVAREVREVILEAIARIEKYTCIKFISNRRCIKGDRKPCILFIKPSRAYRGVCSAMVGPKDQNEIYMEELCGVNIGTVIHEIGHALGMEHEHSRPDRDKYITVAWKYLRAGRGPQLKKKPYRYMEVLGGIPYDYYRQLNKWYNCAAQCSSRRKRHCRKRGGFLTKDCKCLCKPAGDRTLFRDAKACQHHHHRRHYYYRHE